MAAFALNLLIFLPLLAGVAIWFVPRSREALAPRIALVVSLITFGLSFMLWLGVSGTELVGVSNAEWIRVGDSYSDGALATGLVIRYFVGLDGLSAPLVALTGLLVPLAVACSFTSIKTRVRDYYAWMMLLTSAMFGVFAARDLLLFYMFFEFTLAPLYFLIGIWGGSERRRAAVKFFLYTIAGSMLTFAGIMYIAVRSAALRGSGVVELDFGTLLSAFSEGALTQTEQIWLLLALFAGFAVKVPLFPLHTWLPLAHTEAPTAGSVLLAGVLLKLGTYGFLRFALPMVPEGVLYWIDLLATLSVMGIIYGALVSWVQRDVKKLVAYSSVSHLGFCMLGMFSLIPVGLSGSVLYMINHGLSTGALFLCVGMLYERYHTRDMHAIGGLATRMPLFAFFLVLFTLSSIGLPGLNGFVSEFTTLFAAFNSPVLGPWYGVLGATGILLGAIYMLYMMGRVLFGPLKEPPNTPDLSAGLKPDLTGREIAILTPLAVTVVVLGVAPRLVTDALDPVMENEVLARYPTVEQVSPVARDEALATPVRVEAPFGEGEDA